MVGRDVGRMGQSEFETLCTSAHLTRNASREDKTGWDYLVEFPLLRPPGQPADMTPPALECRVQVKATDKHRCRWDIPLRNLERLVKSPIPAFICLLEFNGEEHAQHVYLVHVGEVIIERTLKRLRRLEKDSRNATEKPTLSITCDDSHRLPRPSGACLREAIESHICGGFDKYCRRKKTLLDTLGYETGYGHVDVKVSGDDPLQDLIDLSLGLRKSIKVDEVSWHDTRFKVDCVLPSPSGPAELSLSPATVAGTVAFRERKSSPGIEFAASVHTPSINRVVPRERISFRIQTKLFEILVQPIGRTGRFTLVSRFATVVVSLAEARRFLMLMCMMKARGSKGVWMEVMVDSQSLTAGSLLVQQPDDWSHELKIVEQALGVARVYGIEDKVSMSIDNVVRLREPIIAFHNIIQGQTEGAIVTFPVIEDPAGLCTTGGVIFRGRLSFGVYLLHCIVGMTGPLEKIGDKQYRLTSQGKCLFRCARTGQNQKIDDTELADLSAEIEAEMKAKGIKAVIVPDRQP